MINMKQNDRFLACPEIISLNILFLISEVTRYQQQGGFYIAMAAFVGKQPGPLYRLSCTSVVAGVNEEAW